MGNVFKCRVCGLSTFGEPFDRDSKGKSICKYCVEKGAGKKEDKEG